MTQREHKLEYKKTTDTNELEILTTLFYDRRLYDWYEGDISVGAKCKRLKACAIICMQVK